MSTPVLELRGAVRIHGTGTTAVHALRGVDLAVAPGEMVAVMGPSGSGKSTLLTLAGGLDTATSGEVLVEGVPLSGLDPSGLAQLRRRSVGYVFQELNLLPALTAAENVALPLELDGTRARDARTAALRALDELGISALSGRFPDDLSGGEQQRVAIAYGQGFDDYDTLAALARRALPGEPVREVTGLPAPVFDSMTGSTDVQVCRVSEQPQDGRCYELSGDYSSGYGSDLLVGSSGLAVLEGAVTSGALRAAQRDLEQGRVLLTGPSVVPGEPVVLRLTRFTLGPDGREQATVLETARGTAARLDVTSPAPVRAVLPAAVAEPLGGAEVVGLIVGTDLTREQEQALAGALRRVDENLAVRVERGYQDTGDRTVLLVLSLVAGVLVLAGTLAATSLALTEARPDLTTLGQVGARPRTRRAVAAGYALVLGLVGALLGVAAGLVPGIAAAVPLTRDYASSGPGPQSSYIVQIPWSLLALVLVVLPLVAAAVAGLSARSGTAVARREIA